MNSQRISLGDMMELRRWNTPTIYNGWERITAHNASKEGFNLEECRDFMPHLGPMAGFAVTLIVEPSNPKHKENDSERLLEYLHYLESVGGPKIVVVQDLDKPRVIGSFWGEVSSNFHKALGCIGTITDGAVRDVDEMTQTGFKAIARCYCVGHAYATIVKWNCEVSVFGRKIQPGQLIHADKHGFLAVPFEDEKKILNAATFLDQSECQTFLAATKNSSGKSHAEFIESFKESIKQYGSTVIPRFSRKGEW